MRQIVRECLGQSLRTLNSEDRAAAAWTIACGRVLAERSTILDLNEGVLRIGVTDAAWLQEFLSMRLRLLREVAQIANVAIIDIHFELMPVVRTEEGTNE